MSTTAIHGTLVAIGTPQHLLPSEDFDYHTRALVHVAPEAIRSVPGSMVVIVSAAEYAELMGVKAGLRELLAEMRDVKSEWVGQWERLEKYDDLLK